MKIKYISNPQKALIKAYGGTVINIMTWKQAWNYIYKLAGVSNTHHLV